MKLLIVGGSGFVSGTLARSALAAGHAVTVVTRGRHPVPAGAVAIQADRHQRDRFIDAIAAVPGEWDLVVDCIGYEPDDVRQDVKAFGGRAGQFVFISTDFVYDPARRSFPQPEDGPFVRRDGYGKSKRQCEEVLLATDPGLFAWTILRPCHIYGPGSLLGCLPLHGRDPNLRDHLLAGQALHLVGDGHFLQQPIFAPDLARIILSVAGNSSARGRIFNTAGPDIVESRRYYEIIAELWGVEVRFSEAPVGEFLREQPEKEPFCCHRIYDLTRLRAAGLHVPATPLTEGLRIHVASLPQNPK